MALLGKIGGMIGKGKQIGTIGSANPASMLAVSAENKPGSAAGQLMELGKLAQGMGAFSGSPPGAGPEQQASLGGDQPPGYSLGVNTDLGYGQMPEYGALQRRMNRLNLRGGT